MSVDRIYIQDGNSPTIARLFQEHGFERTFDPSRIAVFFDHSVIWPNREIANRIREAMTFCERLGLTVFRGGEGISHVVAMEQGWFEPGSIVLGTDSHTCVGGANQALALGMGASDVVAAMLTGETWLKVPESVRIETRGAPSNRAGAKDVLLYALAELGQHPFLYRSIEWRGPWIDGLGADEADTLASMAVDMGAKCTFLPPHAGRPHLAPLPEAEPALAITLDIGGLEPWIARPNDPSHGVPLAACAGEPINYVFIGSCTNSRLSDLAEAAHVLASGKVHPSVHCIVTPGSRSIWLQAMELGYVETFLNAGAVVTPPGCGACLGTQGSIPADGDRIVSTMNRNFLGRMGNPRAEIFLSSPTTAALAAIEGRLPSGLEASS